MQIAIFFLGIHLLSEPGLAFIRGVTEVELICDNTINTAGASMQQENVSEAHRT